MTLQKSLFRSLASLGLTLLVLAATGSEGFAAEPGNVLIVIGPSGHPAGTHEVAAGARLMAWCLENAENVDGISVTVSEGWPEDDDVIREASTIVFTGDTFPAERLPDSDRIMQRLGTAMNRGAGIVCVHYATGLRDEDVADDGEHPLLHWMGGYFATRCRHHQSIARIWTATIEPSGAEHPVSRGWKPFTLHDEPYINNYFGPNGPAANVTPIAVAMLPPDKPQREVVAWAVERGDGGRGMGVVMPHFYRSWQQESLRTMILNGIVWSAQVDVPVEGVKTTLPDLTTFEPGAVEPKPRKP